MSKVRDTLERWFYNYPEEEKKELKSRFKKDFDSSFYELFLHELFCKLGYDITIHPDLPSSPKKTDFLIAKDNLELYIEAKVVKGKTMEQEAFERKRNELYDNLVNSTLAVSNIRNRTYTDYEVYLIDYGYGNFKEKIHFME